MSGEISYLDELVDVDLDTIAPTESFTIAIIPDTQYLSESYPTHFSALANSSYALRLLRTAGLVQRRRQGRLHFYRLADDDTQPALRSALTELLQLSEQGPFTR